MSVIRKGTEYCQKCGRPLYDFVEYILPGGDELDADITNEYSEHEGGICIECCREMEKEEEEENEIESV